VEISNKTLAWLVITAVIISFAGTLVSLYKLNNMSSTGYFTYNTTGTASVDVSKSVVLRYAISSVNFGSGSVNSSLGFNNCTLSINGSATIYKTGCEGFNSTNIGGDSFILENAGTSYLNVTLNFSNNASTFMGGNGSLARFRYGISENETGSCVGTISNTTWTDAIENATINICTNLSWADATDTIRIGINISIPENAAGSKSVNITAQGTGI